MYNHSDYPKHTQLYARLLYRFSVLMYYVLLYVALWTSSPRAIKRMCVAGRHTSQRRIVATALCGNVHFVSCAWQPATAAFHVTSGGALLNHLYTVHVKRISCSGEGCHIATLGAGVNIIVFQAAECDIIRVHHSINLHLQFTLYK